jgi:hypothetical protein
MKRLLSCVGGLCFACAAFAQNLPQPSVVVIPATNAVAQTPPQAEAGHAAKIICEKPDYDFGSAEAATIVTHEYVIKNGGDLTLEIKRVQPSCGCTVAKLSQQMVKPGDTAVITATLSLAGRSGHQDKHIIVESSDPQSPTIILNLHGDVRQDILIQPERLSPGQIRGDTPFEMDITFVNNSSGAVHVARAQSVASNLSVVLTETEPGKKYQIHVKTVPPLMPGPVDGLIHLFTDYPTRPVFDVPFNAVVLGPLVVAPPEILLSMGMTNPVVRFIVVRPGTASTYKILGVETPDPAMMTEQAQIGPEVTRIQINNIVARPELSGKAVKITTDIESMKEIFVPFQVIGVTGK